MARNIQISDAEWEIMKVLWQAPGLTANEVAERLADTKQWHLKTVRTLLDRLLKKGDHKAREKVNDQRAFPLVRFERKLFRQQQFRAVKTHHESGRSTPGRDNAEQSVRKRPVNM